MPVGLGLSIVALTIASIRRWRRRGPIDLEGAILLATLLMGVVGGASVLLGIFDALTPGTLATVLVATALALLPWRSPASLPSANAAPLDRRRVVLTAALLLGAAALRWPAIDHALAGRDQGTYALRAASTARTGSFDVVDPIVRDATSDPDRPGAADIAGLYPRRGEAWRDDVYEAGYRPGWYLADRETGRVVPQFLHLFPALCTVALWIGGDDGPGVLVILQGVLCVAALLALGRRVLPDPRWALLGATALAISPLAIWVHRNTLTETLTGLLTLAAALAFARGREHREDLVLGAALLATTAWVRGNAWITAPAVLATLWLVPVEPGRHRATAVFVAVLAGGIAVHALTVFPYLHDELARQFARWSEPSGLALVAVFAVGLLAWWSLDEIGFGPRSPRGPVIAARLRPALPWALAVGLAAALATWAVRAATHTSPPWSRLDAMLPGIGPVLLVAAAVGLVLALPAWARRVQSAGDVWLVAIAGLVVTTAWAYANRNLPKFGLYYYGRYLVPELLPAACLAGTFAAVRLHSAIRGRRARLSVVTATVVCVGLLGPLAWPLVATPQTRLREYDGARRIVDALAERVPPEAIVVAGGEGWHHGHTFNQVAGALAMRYGRSIVPGTSREAAYATLHELLVDGPAARGTAAPRVFLLVNEATHVLAASVRGAPVAALDDGLPPPLRATSVTVLELVTDRLTPTNDALPGAVTRDALRMGLVEVVVDPGVDVPRIGFGQDATEPASRGIRLTGDRSGCLDPERPLELDVAPELAAQTAAIVVVAAAEHAGQAEGWSVTIDGEARANRAPGIAPRSRASLGPFATSAALRRIGVHGSPRADDDARCPHGELREVRLLGREHGALADATFESVVLAPPRDLGHPIAPVRWVSGRGLSRLRPQAQGDAASGETAVRANALALVAGTPLQFAPEPQAVASFDVVVNLTASTVSPDARIAVWADDVLIGRVDPPDRRDRSWQSPPLSFTALGPVTRWRLELEGELDGGTAWVRDLGLFSRSP
jgi:hypothetical protein